MFSIIGNVFISFFKGLILGGNIVILGYLMDFTICKASQRKIIKEKPDSFLNAHYYISTNLLIISPITYVAADNLLLSHSYDFNIFKYIAIMLTQNIFYFFLHREMHRNNYLKKIHNFHHEFDVTVSPSIGNAVTHSEFILSYIIPFLISALLYHPSEITFFCSIETIAILNLLIHTKELDGIWWIPGLVAPTHHIKHHKVRTENYAAPLVNIDQMEEYIFVA